MATRVLLTVDTEISWAHYGRGGSWREVLERSYDPAGVGVPYQLRVLGEHGLKACFFVDPMPALLYGLEPVRRMVEPILGAGQEVQLHLHPLWTSIAAGRDPGRFDLTAFDEQEQRELIRAAGALLAEAGAPDPIAFRAGSFAADGRTLQVLRDLGIRYDSSHNGRHHPAPSNLPLDLRQLAPIEIEGVVEVPVTVLEEWPRGVRHLQIAAVSFDELSSALLHAAEDEHPVVTIVSHSFELATRDARRPNRTLCRRFERLCGFLAEHRDRLPTAHFADLDDLRLGAEATPLPAAAGRTLSRMAEQLASNLLYERGWQGLAGPVGR